MKILVCTDGSEHSQKALQVAADIAKGSPDKKIAIIYVYDNRHDTYLHYGSPKIAPGQIEKYQEATEEDKKERKKILRKARKFLQEKNIKARTIYQEGHPSHTIVKVAQEEGFDLIVIGSEGLSGLKKLFLGSVSNAVIQEAKNCSVLLVK